MAITNGYATLAQVKQELGVKDEKYDSQLERHIEAASRMIDQDRYPLFFYSSTETKYFTAHFADEVHIDYPLAILTTLAIYKEGSDYDTTIQASDFDAIGTPIHTIYIKPSASERFPISRYGVKVTGVWGAIEVPKAIEDACVLIAKMLFMRKDAVQGVLDGGEQGTTKLNTNPINDPYVRGLLDSVSHAEVY